MASSVQFWLAARAFPSSTLTQSIFPNPRRFPLWFLFLSFSSCRTVRAFSGFVYSQSRARKQAVPGRQVGNQSLVDCSLTVAARMDSQTTHFTLTLKLRQSVR